MKRIKATFIGTDGSLGYKTGKEYSLFVRKQLDGETEIYICRVSGGGACIYSDLYAFIKNWTLIKTDTELDAWP